MRGSGVFRLTPVRETRRAIPGLIILGLLVVAASLFRSSFLTWRNLSNVLVQVAPLAMVSLGQTVVLLVGGIDLSVGAMISLATVLLANSPVAGGLSWAAGVGMVMGTALLVGGLHAWAVLKAKVHPLILTLGTMAILRGIAYWIQPIPGGAVPLGVARWVNWRMGPLSVPAACLATAYAVAVVILTRTTWGQYVYATGTNAAHASLAGIRTGRIMAGAYITSSMLAAFAGVLVAGRIFSGDAMVGEPFTVDSLTASVIGGTSVLGGSGTPVGTLVGSVLLGTLNNVLNLFRVPAFYQYLLKGVLLLVTLLAMSGREVRRNGGERH